MKAKPKRNEVDNIPSRILYVVEPVRVTREEAKMIMDYQREETDLFTAHLQPRPKPELKLI